MTRWIATVIAGLLARSMPLAAQTPTAERCPSIPASATTKVCAIEPKPTTKVVHGAVCKEYCLPYWTLMDLIRKCGGGADCGSIRSRNVLTKKTVPCCPVPACVVKEAPVDVEPIVTSKQP